MTAKGGFYDWVRQGRESEPPAGLADRVMERIRGLEKPESEAPARPGFFERLMGASTAAAAVFALAFGLGMTRNGLLLLIVLFAPGKGL